MNSRDTLCVNNKGHLEISGVDSTELIKEFGSPLYVIDESYVRKVSASYIDTIKECYGNGNVAYASKAFSTMAIYKLAEDIGLCTDVVSGGEIFTALKAGFNPANMYFHGNNKLYQELDLAISNKLGKIVIDNIADLPVINTLAKKYETVQKVLVRVNPGVEAHTHEFIQTAKVDSKFGFGISNGDADNIINEIHNYKNIEFFGLHCHIGSQIFDTEPFLTAVDIVTEYSNRLNELYGYKVQELNFGGGFGITYTSEDPTFKPEEYARYVRLIAERLNQKDKEYNLGKPIMTIEPGRSLIGEAGVTLYTAGTIKTIPEIRKYVSIDGGMTDNIRPALYGAKYEIMCANKMLEEHDEVVTISGKCCESGDLIAKDIKLPNSIQTGDIIATFATGAYCYSMASHYNRNLVPAVVMCYEGKADYIVKPESYEDVVRNDVIPERLK